MTFLPDFIIIENMEITAITPQVKDKLRCNIEVDGRFYCGMKLETVMQHRLKTGLSVSEEYLSVIQLESEKMTALDKALSFISLSMKTEKQIREYLKKKGYLAAICDFVIEKMRSYGYLDDGLYAKNYTESAGKKKGKRLIAAELRQKGVSDAAIDEALSAFEGEEEGAKRVLEKYLRNKELDVKTLHKAYGYLLSKGYGYDVAKRAIASYGEVDED